MSTSTPVWCQDCCKLLMTLPLMTFLKPLPCWMASLLPPHNYSQPPPSDPTYTLIPPSGRVTMAQQRLLAPAFTSLTPLSRCWIWSNHSQSSLNISFFKQNRSSKFHHSMTRSVANNTIKPIPAYPVGGGVSALFQWRQLGDESGCLQKGVNLSDRRPFVSHLFRRALRCCGRRRDRHDRWVKKKKSFSVAVVSDLYSKDPLQLSHRR